MYQVSYNSLHVPLKMVQPTPKHIGNYMKPETLCFLMYGLVKKIIQIRCAYNVAYYRVFIMKPCKSD
jgi:hypothetical protein